MKNIFRIKLFACVLAICTMIFSAQALAMTDQEFKGAVEKQGLHKAVSSALSEGMTIKNILAAALAIEGMDPGTVLIALFQAETNYNDVINAAYAQGLTPTTIISASRMYQQGKVKEPLKKDASTEASKEAAKDESPKDHKAQAPAVSVIPVAGLASAMSPKVSEPYASPSTF